MLNLLVKASSTACEQMNTVCALVSIQNGFVELEDSIQEATSKISASPVLEAADAQSVRMLVTSLSSAVTTSVLNIGLARTEFIKALMGKISFTPIVKGHLERLHPLVEDLLNELKVKLSNDPDTVQTVLAALSNANGIFASQLNDVYGPDRSIDFNCKI